MKVYFFKDKKVVPCENFSEWLSVFYTDDSRFIRKTKIKDYLVSTVFLGFDHGFNPDVPVLFETMIFKGEDHETIYMKRSCSYEEAENVHNVLCNLLRLDFNPD